MRDGLIFIFLEHRLAFVIQLLVPPVEHLLSTLLAGGRAGSINIDFFVSASDADVLDSAHFFSPNCRVAPARSVVGCGDQKRVRRFLLE
jgi:hypothetical protein